MKPRVQRASSSNRMPADGRTRLALQFLAWGGNMNLVEDVHAEILLPGRPR